MTLHIAYEGPSDLPLCERLARDAGFTHVTPIVQDGSGRLSKTLRRYNEAARTFPWLVVRDLDRVSCPPILLARERVRPSEWMCYRIAVRAMEAWLIADRAGLSAFTGLNVAAIPTSPETLRDPKATLIELAGRSPDRALVRAMVPRPGEKRKVGPEYTAAIAEFVRAYWSPDRAGRSSESLRRCRRALSHLRERWERVPR